MALAFKIEDEKGVLLKIYLAGTAPGNEPKDSQIVRRLLSFYFVYVDKKMMQDLVFDRIIRQKKKDLKKAKE